MVMVARRSGSATRSSGSTISSRSALRTSSCVPREVGAAPTWMTRSGWYRSRKPGVGGEEGARGHGTTAKTGQWLCEQWPAAFDARFDQSLRRNPQPSGDHHNPVAGVHLAQERRHVIGERVADGHVFVGDRRCVQWLTARHQRFPKWEIQMYRPRRLKQHGLMDRRVARGKPAVSLVLMPVVHGHAGVAEPLDERAEKVLLVDRLIGADTVELRRPVCRHDDDGHARQGRFHHRREMVCGCGAGRAEHRNGLSCRGRHAEPEERRGSLVHVHVQGDARMASGRKRDRR
jgi:hypothetical protein